MDAARNTYLCLAGPQACIAVASHAVESVHDAPSGDDEALSLNAWIGSYEERQPRAVRVRHARGASWLCAESQLFFLPAARTRQHPLPAYVSGLSGALGIVGVLTTESELLYLLDPGARREQ